jgi:diguanylate cyclase (GGDEF)-like protein/PAS domain S-box-containing protein
MSRSELRRFIERRVGQTRDRRPTHPRAIRQRWRYPHGGRKLDPPRNRPQEPMPTMNMPAAALRLLLVDREALLLSSLRELIAPRGYEAEIALSGAAAIERLSNETFDIVLLDLFSSGVDGHKVMAHIAEKQIPTSLILTGGHETGIARPTLQYGELVLLRKPYRAEELLRAIDNALARKKLAHKTRQGAQALQRSEQWHRFLVDNSPDIIYSLDPEGRFAFLNRRVESLLGYSQQELIGKHYTFILHEEDWERARFVFNERLAGARTSTDFELRLKTRHGSPHSMYFETRFIDVGLNAEYPYRASSRQGRKFHGAHGVAKDISDRKKADEVIYHRAYHDSLTGLPNRLLFNDHLTLAIAQAKRNRSMLAVMFLDLDRFKAVNDTLGHGVGDQLLQGVASRLGNCVREGDTLARQGGDEFTLLLPHIADRQSAENTARKIRSVLESPFCIDRHEQVTGASIGIAVYPDDGDSVEALIKNADTAMYEVKARGRNNYAFFSPQKRKPESHAAPLANDPRKALLNGELEIYYQPLISVETGRISGMEALLRWNHPVRGRLLPSEFIPLAEEYGHIGVLGEWVLRSACVQARAWQVQGQAPVRLAVNVSTHQIEQDDFIPTVLGAIGDSGLDPGLLDLEITESVMMKNFASNEQKLKQLSAFGVKISIDDFGTGFSSLSYLRHLPVHTLKIDRLFVQDIVNAGADNSIVSAMVLIAKGLKLKLVAEGVETFEQLEFLRGRGCEEFQGHFFSKPVPATEATRLIALQHAAPVA